MVFLLCLSMFFIFFMFYYIIGIWNAVCILIGVFWINIRWFRWCDEGKFIWIVRKYENSLAILVFIC